LAELYAAQAGQLLLRVKSETASTKIKSEFAKTWGLMDSFWEHSPNPICVLDTNGRVLRISRSGAEKMGLTPKMIEGSTLDKLFLPSYYEIFMERLQDICLSREPHFYSDVVNFDGNEGLLEYSLFPIKNKEDNSVLIGMVTYDMARSRQTEEQLEFISLHDTITGLNNRLYFEKEIKNLQDSHGFPLTVLSLDVDGLKIVNETMGYDRGNQLLRDLSRILKSSLRGSDLLARTGGDEFTIILYHTDQKGAEAVIARIESKIVEHNHLSTDIMLNVSLGQATAFNSEENINDVLKRADEHLYHNKLFQKKSSRSQIISSLMAALAERDYITQGHATRLLDLSVKLGTRKVLDPRTLTALALLSQVHDVGKVGIPDKILFKPGKLNDEEWEIMRMHPEKGYRIAIVSPDLKDIADLILKHHERWDGSGYPLGLKGEDIPMECRILSVIDSFDAMTSERPYNKPRSKEEAVQEIKRCAGTQFDPDIVDLFVEVIDEGKVS
jgi:diguanylate cyclase (GGDEF)-like protein/PAS domain S-box-containing protein